MSAIDRIIEWVGYNPETGSFWRRIACPGHSMGSKVGHVRKQDGYLRIMVDGKSYLGHRVAWVIMKGEWPPDELDHEDTNRSNNKWSNTRLADRHKNTHNTNMKKSNTSGFKGVSWRPSHGRFVARISVDNVRVHLGYFDTAKDAHVAYVQAAKHYYGEFANDGTI